MSIESPDSFSLTPIPTEYKAYAEVFSKEKATGLPPHCDYNCTIDLLPSTTKPRGRIYPLSRTEHLAMEEYIQEALK